MWDTISPPPSPLGPLVLITHPRTDSERELNGLYEQEHRKMMEREQQTPMDHEQAMAIEQKQDKAIKLPARMRDAGAAEKSKETDTDNSTAATPRAKTQVRSKKDAKDDDSDDDGQAPDLEAGGNIYNYSEIHAQVTQEAGHWSHVSNGNAVSPSAGRDGLALLLGIGVGAVACLLWRLRNALDYRKA